MAGERVGEHRALDLGGLGHRATVGDVEQHVEQEQEPGASGVDHAGLLEHREHVRGAFERIGAPCPGRLQHATRSPPSSAAATAASADSRTTVRIVPSTGRITAS